MGGDGSVDADMDLGGDGSDDVLQSMDLASESADGRLNVLSPDSLIRQPLSQHDGEASDSSKPRGESSMSPRQPPHQPPRKRTMAEIKKHIMELQQQLIARAQQAAAYYRNHVDDHEQHEKVALAQSRCEAYLLLYRLLGSPRVALTQLPPALADAASVAGEWLEKLIPSVSNFSCSPQPTSSGVGAAAAIAAGSEAAAPPMTFEHAVTRLKEISPDGSYISLEDFESIVEANPAAGVGLSYRCIEVVKIQAMMRQERTGTQTLVCTGVLHALCPIRNALDVVMQHRVRRYDTLEDGTFLVPLTGLATEFEDSPLLEKLPVTSDGLEQLLRFLSTDDGNTLMRKLLKGIFTELSQTDSTVLNNQAGGQEAAANLMIAVLWMSLTNHWMTVSWTMWQIMRSKCCSCTGAATDE